MSWEQFVRLPDPEDGARYELHDGEVVVIPPRRPRHVSIQLRLQRMLQNVTRFGFTPAMEYPYKPSVNYQFGLPTWLYCQWLYPTKSIPGRTIKPTAPPLVIEILSPSNREAKISRQRIVSMSNGTKQFWVVDGDQRVVHVTTPQDSRTYTAEEEIPIPFLPGWTPSLALPGRRRS